MPNLELFANNATAKLNTAILTAPAAGTIESWTMDGTESYGSGWGQVPSPAAGQQLRFLCGTEILYCTAINTGTHVWTVTRAQESSTAATHTTADVINVDVTGGSLGVCLQLGQPVAATVNQTTDLSQWTNSAGLLMKRVDPLGRLTVAGNLTTAIATPTTPTLNVNSTTGGTLAAGVWKYAITDVDTNGKETLLSGSLSVTTTGTTSAVTINITAGAAGTTKRNIYRTAVGGTVFFYLATVADNTTLTYQDTGSVTLSALMPPLSQWQGVLNIGAGLFDGVTAGKFSGSASGTGIALNMPSGYAGSLIDLQVNGVTKFNLSSTGASTFYSTLNAGVVIASNLLPSTAGGASFIADNGGSGPTMSLSASAFKFANKTTVSNNFFTIQGIASQTGDLTQWQNSTPTTLSGVRSDGLIYANRNAANLFSGLSTVQKAGTPADTDWATAPPDGTIVVDSTGNKIWVRVSTVWKSVAVA